MPLSFIHRVVEAEIKLGHVVDVEKHCHVLNEAFPELPHTEIQNMILQIVAQRGGAAAWGNDEQSKL